ncbi:hypothetical protein AK812_SmicGene18740 [Symbiodinium microadriaticum]|uniref:Uncharacterized protein n=1 Tax=Symbiodinium microadriaticum TaxID=2951 RepID=A0A1Q9DUG3_SYMMI|nr:hypothetical protein AK812_SmicGene18740 [Symbiodinium microadriaticum]
MLLAMAGRGLKSGKIPDNKLVEMIAVLKVKAIETSISACFKLKQEHGGTGFEKLDYLQCCKFAEGDSRILMQKLTRDRLQAFAKSPSGKGKEAEVYGLADMVMERTIDEVTGAQSNL